MEIYHKLELIDNINQLVIYVAYPDEYEFSLDFDSLKKNISTVSDTIREYALKNIDSISNNTALLVLNGVIVGTLLLSNLTSTAIATKTEDINQSLSQIESVVTTDEDAIKKISTEITEQEISSTESIDKAPTDIQNNNETIKNSSIESIPNTTQTSNTKNIEPVKGTPSPTQVTAPKAPTVATTEKATPPIATKTQEKMVSLKLNSGSIIQISLEEYVIGVVSAEMPASFQVEALKAQAVVARTYALKRISSGTTLTATTSNQVYKTESELKQMWGSSFTAYYTKIQNAVNTTKGEYITYNGSYIDALYFSTSNGKTEDSVNVWGNSFAYLKSVDSSWDKNVSGFSQTKSISISTISSKLGVNLASVSQIVINSKTIGDRVNSITVVGKNFTGVKIRTLLGLRSADFTISQDGQNIIFTTRGYGHGVGMSQYGANEMSKSGKTYSQIIYHYYTGIKINK